MIALHPIGVVHSPYKTPLDAPRQGQFATAESVVEIFLEYEAGLLGAERLEELLVFWWADRADRTLLARDEKGVFAGRAPHRPNPIAISAVRLLRREGRKLVVRGLEALDGTPVLDLKSAHPEWEGWSALPDVAALQAFNREG